MKKGKKALIVSLFEWIGFPWSNVRWWTNVSVLLLDFLYKTLKMVKKSMAKTIAKMMVKTMEKMTIEIDLMIPRSVSGEIIARFLDGPVGLCSSSILSDVSVARSLCPYSPSPYPPSCTLHPLSLLGISLLFTLHLLPLLLGLVVLLLQHQLGAGDFILMIIV